MDEYDKIAGLGTQDQSDYDTYDAIAGLTKEEKNRPGITSVIASDITKGAKRLAGVAIGVVDAPRAYIQGAQAAKVPAFKPKGDWIDTAGQYVAYTAKGIQQRHKEGLQSAYEAIAKPGSFGVTYDDYFKQQRGVSIQEAWDKRLGVERGNTDPISTLNESASNVIATLQSFAGNISRDPTIGLGMTIKILKSGQLPGAIGRAMLPEERVLIQNNLDFLDHLTRNADGMTKDEVINEITSSIKKTQAGFAKTQKDFAAKVAHKAHPKWGTYEDLIRSLEDEEQMGQKVAGINAGADQTQAEFAARVSHKAEPQVGAYDDLVEDLRYQEQMGTGSEDFRKMGGNVEKAESGADTGIPEEIARHKQTIFEENVIKGQELAQDEAHGIPAILDSKALETSILSSEGLNAGAKEATNIISGKNFFDKAAKGSTTMKAVAGTGIGFDVDENGDIKFDPEAAVAGAGGMVLGISMFPKFKNASYLNKAMQSESLRALEAMLGKQEKAWKGTGFMSLLHEKLFNRYLAIKPYEDAYEKIRTYQSHKDVSWIKLNELKNAFRPIVKTKNAEDIMSRYILAFRSLSRQNTADNARDMLIRLKGTNTAGMSLKDKAALKAQISGAEARMGIKNPTDIPRETLENAIVDLEKIWESNGGDVAALRKAKDDFNAWTRKYILDEGVESGLISQEARDRIIQNNEFYATFDVIDHMPEDINKIPSLPSGEYFSVQNQKVFKAMKGTEKKIDDPLGATIRKFIQAQSTYERNRVASALVEDELMAEIIRPVAKNPKQFAILQAQGKNPVAEGSWSKEFDTISRLKGGEVETYLVPKEVAEAMKRMSPRQIPFFSHAANIFRNTATTWYLPFTITNMFRDSLMAYVTSPTYKSYHAALYPADWGKGVVRGIKYEFLGSDKIVEDYLRAGGGFGYSGEATNANLSKKMLFKHGVDYVKDPRDWVKVIEKITGSIELAPRLAVYTRALKQGKTAREAAMLARAATIDFSKGGQWTKVTNQFVPFVNARFQAWNTIYNAARHDPVNTGIKAFSTVFLPAMGLYAWNRTHFSDLYDDIPGYIRDNNFCFIFGSDTDDKGRIVPKYFTIPKGDIGSLICNPIEYALDREYDSNPMAFGEWIAGFLSDLSPIPFARGGDVSVEKAAGSLMPPPVKAGYELGTGRKSYTGLEVVPQSMKLQGVPPELQFTSKTPEPYKWIGRRLGLSPLVMQNFMQNLFAGYGREALDPAAMLNGLTGRMAKSVGGAKEQRAWEEIAEMEKGYKTTRAFTKELIALGEEGKANDLMDDWNNGIQDKVDGLMEIDPDFEDKGNLLRSYTFSERKKKNLTEEPDEDEDLSPLMQRLAR